MMGAPDYLIDRIDSLLKKCRYIDLWCFFDIFKSLHHHLDCSAARFASVCHSSHSVTYNCQKSDFFICRQDFAFTDIQCILLIISVSDGTSCQCGHLRNRADHRSALHRLRYRLRLHCFFSFYSKHRLFPPPLLFAFFRNNILCFQLLFWKMEYKLFSSCRDHIAIQKHSPVRDLDAIYKGSVC